MRAFKNIFDFSSALFSLLILIIPMIFMYLLILITTQTNGVFIQKRVGRNAKLFNLYKFRTMRGEYTSTVTTHHMRITPIGKILRKYKLDELPQLINVLKGDMSWVGPRPDVSGYADALIGEDRIILTVKPGITGPAQIKYRNEEEILSKVDNPQYYNDEVVWKDKVQINKEYIKDWNFFKDLHYLWKTLFSSQKS